MGTYTLMIMLVTSLLVLFPLMLEPVGSESLDDIHANSRKLDSNNDPSDFSSASSAGEGPSCPQAREEVQCPAVCAACPACPSAPPCLRRIPPGYQYYQGLGYYKMHYDSRSWHEAVAACEAEGGYLAVLNSQEEANIINSLMENRDLTSQVHIGFVAAPKIQTYLTVLGDDMSSTGYEVWAPGQPDGAGSENCGAFGTNEGLHDVLCTAALPSFCELDQ